MIPRFSVLHTTARPEKWRAAYLDWMRKAANPEQVEYVLCVDERWGFTGTDLDLEDGGYGSSRAIFKCVWNEGPMSAVSGWNTAGRAATGQILLVSADDFFPCQNWDVLLWERCLEAFPVPSGMSNQEQSAYIGSMDFALRVSTGVPEADIQGHICHAFMSRARYEHHGGHVYFPEYEGVFCDNDFTAHAEQDGVILDARHLQFEHRHPGYRPAGFSMTNPELDAAFWHHNKPIDRQKGRAIFETRKRERFGHAREDQLIIGLCLSGERFEGAWFDAFFNLYDHLQTQGWRIWRMREYVSNVSATRGILVKTMAEVEPRPDYLLWLDDDNTLTPDQFDTLVVDLQEHPEADGVFGWCWIYDADKRSFHISCGLWSPDGLRWNPFEATEFVRSKNLRSVEASGFPVCLMRWSAIEKAGAFPFRTISDDRLPHGFAGEDLSFCRHAEDGGATFLVDPRVNVPHLKHVNVEPAFPETSLGAEPIIAAMLRVKNEARWIARSLQSLKPLCGERIYLMDTGSDDDTREIALRAGAQLLPFPFAGQEIDERRDKNYLMEHVKQACKPDWILCIDGDEELEPGGPEKIRAALRIGDADAYAMRFLHLWNASDTIRIDRWYSTFTRLSLFRPIEGYGFQSLYERQGVNAHAGLHTSNAPVGMKFATLNVFLLHYGYMLKEDRIAKWRWYNQIDPDNQAEDGYRHCVQGDIADVPADMVLRHAGPLELRKLPARLVPLLDVMPEPRQAAMEVTG